MSEGGQQEAVSESIPPPVARTEAAPLAGEIDGDAVMSEGGQQALGESIPPPVARTEATTLAGDDDSNGNGDDDDDEYYHKTLEEMAYFSWLGVGSNAGGVQ